MTETDPAGLPIRPTQPQFVPPNRNNVLGSYI
jgi:hypothetical protein